MQKIQGSRKTYAEKLARKYPKNYMKLGKEAFTKA